MKFGTAMDRDLTLKRGIFPEIAALIFVLLAINGIELAVGQEALSTPVISGKGPHHRVWSRAVQQKLSNGKVITRIVPVYTELAGGMHYWSDEQKDWVESSSEIEVINGLGVARHGQHQVIWAANANTAGAVDLQSADGKRFLSHVLGIAFTDRKTGASVFLATTKDSIGQVVGSQVIYKDAFDGIGADIVYTYSPAKFEQDIVFREALPDPSGPPWNMNADSVVVEVYTEFIDPPDAVVKNVTVQSVTDPAVRQAMVEPDMIDQQLDFGAMQIGAGTGFSNGDATANDISVVKSFEVRDQRHVLVEKIEYKAAIGRMVALAKPAALTKDQAAAIERGIKRDRNGVAHSTLPGRPRLAARQEKKPIRTAQLSIPPARGFVMDYSQVNSATNVTLQGDTTYYVSGAVTLAGTTTLEGGTVVKYAPTNSASIKITGPVVCLTGPFKWVTFTARDDHTSGEVIGTNVISGYYGNYGLDLDAITYGGSFTLTYVRVRYANTGLNVFGGKGHAFSHVQLINCSNGYNSYLTDASFRNLLGCSLNRAFTATGGSNTTNRWENVTLDQVQSFNTNSASTCFLTNCLLVAVTNSGSYSGSSNATASTSSSVFQAVGAGLRYLATNSPYRNMGTTNINPTLLTQLKTKTTYPPVIRTNSVTLNTTWAQQVQRDTDVPDIGYHYESIDYMCDLVGITNATLTLGSGTSVSGYGSNPLWLQDGASLISEGTPVSHNVICGYKCFQEQATNWGAALSVLLTSYHVGNNRPVARLRFTDLIPSSTGYLIYNTDLNWDFGSLSIRDCELFSGALNLGGSSNSVTSLTNNLFFRTYIPGVGENQFFALNNLFYGGYIQTDNSGALTNWYLKDNSFDRGTVDDPGNTTNGYNAYINTTGYLYPGFTNGDMTLTNFVYATGPLGFFYQYSTNLVDKGSVTNAGLRGLYHYTTQTNEVKEANTKLDIGYHYVAGDAVTGVSIDTDGDGVPDYFEDTNGNGVFDAGETDWQAYNSQFGIGSGPGLKVFTPLK